jgi:hypothetical protein
MVVPGETLIRQDLRDALSWVIAGPEFFGLAPLEDRAQALKDAPRGLRSDQPEGMQSIKNVR